MLSLSALMEFIPKLSSLIRFIVESFKVWPRAEVDSPLIMAFLQLFFLYSCKFMNRYFKGLKGYKNWIKKVVHKEGMFDIDINLASALMSNQGSFNVLFKQL